MQCEKLYNLHKTACLATAFFAFKMVKVLEVQILTVRRRYFYLTQDEFIFSHFIFLHLFCLSCIELFALHPVVYFVFLNRIFGWYKGRKCISYVLKKDFYIALKPGCSESIRFSKTKDLTIKKAVCCKL